jgi:hypothetical protein
MAREIRVTVDDDEVFERMRARKRDLDLSWEEVLHRGLRPDPEGRSGGPQGPGRRGGGGRHGSGPAGGDIGDRLERRIRQRVEESLESAFGIDQPGSGATPDPDSGGRGRGDLDAEMERLADAEDAVLRFPFLDDHPRNRVLLRVRMETSADGLSVEVVTIRQGKDATGTNRFDRGARREVAERLAGDATAVLELEEGVEEYAVSPVLSWSHADDGSPTVTDVSIAEVSFDA